jgi:hypothetical protein
MDSLLSSERLNQALHNVFRHYDLHTGRFLAAGMAIA